MEKENYQLDSPLFKLFFLTKLSLLFSLIVKLGFYYEVRNKILRIIILNLVFLNICMLCAAVMAISI